MHFMQYVTRGIDMQRLELFCFANEDARAMYYWLTCGHASSWNSTPDIEDKKALWLAARLDNLGKAVAVHLLRSRPFLMKSHLRRVPVERACRT